MYKEVKICVKHELPFNNLSLIVTTENNPHFSWTFFFFLAVQRSYDTVQIKMVSGK